MTKLRLLGAALAAVLMFPAAAFAQQATPMPGMPGTAPMPGAPGTAPRGAHHRHHNGMRAALRGLNLSPAQQQQVDQAYARAKAANQNADRATRKANMQKLRGDIDGILTPAQRTQFQAAMRQMHQRHKRGGFATPAPGATPSH